MNQHQHAANVRWSTRKPLSETFWNRVRKGEPDECWEWQGAINSRGYGSLMDRRNSLVAHRVAYTLTNGEPPDGHYVCHRCDNKRCCNPAHLYAGTPSRNLQDSYDRKRRRVALSPENRSALISDAVAGIGTGELSRKYGIKHTLVCFWKNKAL